MEVSEKIVEEMKEIARKEGKEYTDEEAREAAYNLQSFAELIWDCAKEEAIRAKRLRKEPNGFAIESSRSCCVCGDTITPENGWHDKYGSKCPLCQKAVGDGTIPTFVCINRDSYLPMWKLTHDLKVKTPTIKKLIKEGRLKARMIVTEDGRPHYYLFLRKENPDLMVPNNPARKSYDRHRDKESKKWVRKQTKELKEEWRKRFKTQT